MTGSFVGLDLAVGRDVDEPLLVPLQGVERGEHLEDDLREVLEVELRHVLLSDGAFVATVPVVELGRRVAFGHQEHVFGVCLGLAVLDLLDAVRGHADEDVSRLFPGQSKFLPFELVDAFVFFRRCSSHS